MADLVPLSLVLKDIISRWPSFYSIPLTFHIDWSTMFLIGMNDIPIYDNSMSCLEHLKLSYAMK